MNFSVVIVDDNLKDPSVLEFKENFGIYCYKSGITLKFVEVDNKLRFLKKYKERKGEIDLVLLDIIGVDAGAIISHVSESDPYLPVVLFSNNDSDVRVVVDLMGRGAKTYIPKKDVNKRVSKSQDHFEMLKKFIISFKAIKYDRRKSWEFGRLYKTESMSDIKEQSKYLVAVAQDPDLAELFPRSYGYTAHSDGTGTLEMSYFNMPSLRKYLFSLGNQEEDELSFKRVVLGLMSSLSLYEKTIVRQKSDGDFKFLIGKFRDRKTALHQSKPIIPGRSQLDLLRLAFVNIVNGHEFIIGSVSQVNFDSLISKFGKLNRVFGSKIVKFCHGDLHFDNILVYDNLGRTIVKFIDPGNVSLCKKMDYFADVAFDFGKLFMSSHHLYDFIHSETLRCDPSELMVESSGSVVLAAPKFAKSFNFVMKGGATNSRLEVHSLPVQDYHTGYYTGLHNAVLALLDSWSTKHDDPYLLPRSIMYSCLNMFNVSFKYFDSRPDIALSCLIQALLKSKEFVDSELPKYI